MNSTGGGAPWVMQGLPKLQQLFLSQPTLSKSSLAAAYRTLVQCLAEQGHDAAAQYDLPGAILPSQPQHRQRVGPNAVLRQVTPLWRHFVPGKDLIVVMDSQG